MVCQFGWWQVVVVQGEFGQYWVRCYQYVQVVWFGCLGVDEVVVQVLECVQCLVEQDDVFVYLGFVYFGWGWVSYEIVQLGLVFVQFFFYKWVLIRVLIVFQRCNDVCRGEVDLVVQCGLVVCCVGDLVLVGGMFCIVMQGLGVVGVDGDVWQLFDLGDVVYGVVGDDDMGQLGDVGGFGCGFVGYDDMWQFGDLLGGLCGGVGGEGGECEGGNSGGLDQDGGFYDVFFWGLYSGIVVLMEVVLVCMMFVVMVL